MEIDGSDLEKMVPRSQPPVLVRRTSGEDCLDYDARASATHDPETQSRAIITDFYHLNLCPVPSQLKTKEIYKREPLYGPLRQTP